MAEPSTQVLLECSPAHIFAALYEKLPFPHFAGPRQELVFHTGITVIRGQATLQGLVFTLLCDHQALAEQRWTAEMIRQQTGQSNLVINEGTGLAMPSVTFNEVAWVRADRVQTVAVLTNSDGEVWNETLITPVTFPVQSTDLHFPLAGTWWAIQGNDWTDQHKQEPVSQAFALDFVKIGHDGTFYREDGSQLEMHYSWGAPVYAPASARVSHVIYDMPDMPPGQVPDPAMMQGDARRVLGNAVALTHRKGEFSYLAHLRQGSVQVKVGDHIRRGTLVGYAGNSGHSPGPHVHYHLMNGPNLYLDQALPAKFSNLWAGGVYFEEPAVITSRLIVRGPDRSK